MNNDIERSGNLPERQRGPASHTREDGFQIVQGITAVRIEVRVGPHVSRTSINGYDMEAAMMVEWTDPKVYDRIGTLQFGLRNISSVRNSNEFTFRTDGAW